MKPTPAERGLAARNREILAVRMHWPSGVVAICVDLERRFPDWTVTWLPENRSRGFERPAGFRAVLGTSDGMHDCSRFAEAPDELARMMEQVPKHDFRVRYCAYCIAQAEARMRRSDIEMGLRRERRGQG